MGQLKPTGVTFQELAQYQAWNCQAQQLMKNLWEKGDDATVELYLKVTDNACTLVNNLSYMVDQGKKTKEQLLEKNRELAKELEKVTGEKDVLLHPTTNYKFISCRYKKYGCPSRQTHVSNALNHEANCRYRPLPAPQPQLVPRAMSNTQKRRERRKKATAAATATAPAPAPAPALAPAATTVYTTERRATPYSR